MADKIKCNICGAEFDGDQMQCLSCNVATDMLKKEVHVPTPRGALNDYPGILTDEQAGELSGMLDSFFGRTDVPVVIAIVETSAPLTPGEYAFLIYNHWGIGRRNVNRGLLIMLSLAERHIESEVGLGLEGILPEAEGDRIVQEEFIPHFKDGNYFEGLKAGTNGIIKALMERLPAV